MTNQLPRCPICHRNDMVIPKVMNSTPTNQFYECTACAKIFNLRKELGTCITCANGDHVQCLGGACECIHTPARTDRSVLVALIAKWRQEAAETDADGDFCCALTRRHDADELEAALTVAEARAVQEPKSEKC